MRTTDTILGILRVRGEKGLPLENIYRQLFNPDLYLVAYGHIYSNNGAMTRGMTNDTVDAMSLTKIHRIVEDLRWERYRWTPVRRVEIPKKNGHTRALGLPTWSDKLLQEVLRMILEAYYEPQFSDHSHGFRVGRGCHTALREITHTWRGTKWFIEADIQGCFDNIDHGILLGILKERIHDNRFLRLIQSLLQAGYCENWRYHETLSGTPQGGIVSPLLANIYLDRLDRFVQADLIATHTRGQRRKEQPDYARMRGRIARARRKGEVEKVETLRKLQQALPVGDPHDPTYRRLRYIRYADDFLLGFVGPKHEAVAIKESLQAFLHENLKLDLSEEKTLITHATKQAARFLGYEVRCIQCNTKMTGKKRSVNGSVELRVPATFLRDKCRLYMGKDKPIHLPHLLQDDDFSIVHHYQAQYRGYVQYYLFAQNLNSLSYLRHIMQISLLKTLAAKHNTSAKAMWRKYQTTVATQDGPRACLRVIKQRPGKTPLSAHFGGIALKRNKWAKPVDKMLSPQIRHTEIVKRLLADQCEVCGSAHDVEVHHVHRLANLQVKGRRALPLWMKMMSARRRKTLVLCRKCHHDLHAGRPLQGQIAC